MCFSPALKKAEKLLPVCASFIDLHTQPLGSQEIGAPQSPALLRRLLRAKDRMNATPNEDWSVQRLVQATGCYKRLRLFISRDL